jgi:hypothetical protein
VSIEHSSRDIEALVREEKRLTAAEAHSEAWAEGFSAGIEAEIIAEAALATALAEVLRSNGEGSDAGPAGADARAPHRGRFLAEPYPSLTTRKPPLRKFDAPSSRCRFPPVHARHGRHHVGVLFRMKTLPAFHQQPRRSGATAGGRARVSVFAAVWLAMSAGGAFALSEIKREELPPPAPSQPAEDGTENAVPMPDPISPPVRRDTQQAPTPGTPANDNAPAAESPDDEPIPEVQYDVSALPPEVARMRQLLLEASRSGDIERLRPLIGSGDAMTQLSLAGFEGDPIAYLKSASGDGEGLEILAILEEVLTAGFAHLDAGTDEELYVWPYFFAVPLDGLTAQQKVELFKIVTAGDYEEMKNYGTYIFYRIGITPEGHWAFFVAGE